MADGAMGSDSFALEGLDIELSEAFLVDVDGFEGPMHLLLALARRQKVDLLRISVLELAEQYLGFIDAAKSMRMDLAADYLLMAAWLTYLKSRLMLPKPERTDKQGGDPEDEAARLAFRLQRLAAMRDAGKMLEDGLQLGRDVLARGAPERPKVIKHPIYSTRMVDMMAAFANIQKRKDREKPHQVEKQYVLPLEQARKSIVRVASKLDDWCELSSIDVETGDDDEMPGQSRLASLFAASLDLTKEGKVDLRQVCYLAPIFLRTAKETESVEA